MRTWFMIAVASIALVTCAPGAAQDNAATANDETVIGEIGSLVVPFSLTTYDGKTFTAEDLKGKVTKLIFWFPT